MLFMSKRPTWNLVKVQSGMLIVDHAFKIMNEAGKTGALLGKLAFLELRQFRRPLKHRIKTVGKISRFLTSFQFDDFPK